MRRGFAVLDFETTGISPTRGDRVLEVGAVSMDPDLRIDGAIETLINPKRDVGPTHVHGVTARDVYDAPTFDQVAPSLFKMLDGRVIVGHNVSFDLRFLAAEMDREGYEVPEFVAIDTLQVAKTLLVGEGLPTFKLHDVAAHLGFGVKDVFRFAGLDARPEHSALGDSMVTAMLLSRLIQMTGGSAFWSSHLDRAEALPWPEYFPTEVEAKRRAEGPNGAGPGVNSGSKSVSDVLSALGAPTPRAESTSAYAKLLEESLADRVLDAAEVDALVNLVRSLGIDNVTLGSLHRGHFEGVVRAAWADGVVTNEERQDIVRVAELLGLDDDSVREALRAEVIRVEQAPTQGRHSLDPGSLIVLTGEMSVERTVLEAEILALGFTVGKNVTKKTALVIAADVYTQSGKAKKARYYGIQVLGEEEGLALLRSP